MNFKQYLDEMARSPLKGSDKNLGREKRMSKMIEKYIDAKIAQKDRSHEDYLEFHIDIPKDLNIKDIMDVSDELEEKYKKAGWDDFDINLDWRHDKEDESRIRVKLYKKSFK